MICDHTVLINRVIITFHTRACARTHTQTQAHTRPHTRTHAVINVYTFRAFTKTKMKSCDVRRSFMVGRPTDNTREMRINIFIMICGANRERASPRCTNTIWFTAGRVVAATRGLTLTTIILCSVHGCIH